MKVFISDLAKICNWDNLIAQLPTPDLIKYKNFNRDIRAKQFLVAHTIKNQIQNEFKYISIAHKDNFVIVAASDFPIGVDIEDTSKTRDFKTISEFMNFPFSHGASDFYHAFTLYEAQYKMPHPEHTTSGFYKLGNYMICIVSDEPTIVAPDWANPELVPEQIQ